MTPLWTPRPDLAWCPQCGINAKVETRPSPIGTRWTCLHCGLLGRFGDGFATPTAEQPGFEEKK